MTTEQVWNDYAQNVLQYFTRQTGDRELAKDLRQDVFMKVHKHLPTLRSRDKIHHWLSVIMKNTLNDHRTRHKPDENDLRVSLDDSPKDPTAQLAETCVRNMIGTLPDAYALPLRLSDLEGVKQKDIAKQTGMSLSGVKSRVQRGRQKLREAITGCCHVELNRMNQLVDASCHSASCAMCNV